MDQELIQCRYSCCSSCSCSCVPLFVGETLLFKNLRLRRFTPDRDNIWRDCSWSKYSSIDGNGFLCWYDVILLRWRPWRPSAARCGTRSSVRRLPASTQSACDVISSLYVHYSTVHVPLIHVVISRSTQKSAATWWVKTKRLPRAVQQRQPVPDL